MLPNFASAARSLNQLKRRKILRDYVVIGAVAATAYLEPRTTQDLDIVILVDSDAEYIEVFRKMTEAADGMEGMHHVFAGIPVQIFPTTMKPVYKDVFENAREGRIGNLRVKVASPEHLIMTYLEAFRPIDRIRILELLEVADLEILGKLLIRFDDEEGSLTTKLESIPGAPVLG